MTKHFARILFISLTHTQACTNRERERETTMQHIVLNYTYLACNITMSAVVSLDIIAQVSELHSLDSSRKWYDVTP